MDDELSEFWWLTEAATDHALNIANATANVSVAVGVALAVAGVALEHHLKRNRQ